MMGFGAAIASCMRKFVTFSGRAPRAEYWWFILFSTVVSLVLEWVHTTFSSIADLVFILPQLAVGWRRMHDLGKTGLWNLSPLLGGIPVLLGMMTGIQFFVYVGGAIALLLALYVLYLTIIRGEVGANEYGDDPYNPTADYSVFE